MVAALLTREQWAEWQALNFVAPFLRNGDHALRYEPATGCVWLAGPVVDEQPEWIARQIAPYVPALRRIIRRQMVGRATVV